MPKGFLGRYRIVDELGRGGMGRIYTAVQSSLDRLVVIKQMSPECGAAARFDNEAAIASRLQHPNVIEVFDYFKDGGSSYLVMEFVDGMDLAAVIGRQAPLHPRVAAGVARQVCAALECAHRRGIIHRDIKPRNVLISREGMVKLTDFGVARETGRPELTTAGMVVGTPFYMSPEQASGGTVTGSSDLYSLGVLLYEMVTAKKPFTGSDGQGVIASICRGRYPSPFWRSPHHDFGLSRIIRRAMKRKAAQRYRSAGEMLGALDRYLGWKGQATIGLELAGLLAAIDREEDAETVVQQPAPRRTTGGKE